MLFFELLKDWTMFFKRTKKEPMNWNSLSSVGDLKALNEASKEKTVLLFKHSRTCSISATALGRLERSWEETHGEKLSPFFLDLISHRDVSNQIAQDYGVMHESPQALLIKDGKAIYDESHFGISLNDLLEQVSN